MKEDEPIARWVEQDDDSYGFSPHVCSVIFIGSKNT